ncbi:MAG TPA: hypothetical protein VFU22_09825 [Roseiflexaceae bacterium]|nr:hypothetical protein [Roseiflexaceae bacterium]
MIDPNWSVVDLDPRTWRNIGHLIEPARYVSAAQPGERGLFVLHDGARILRVVDSTSGVRRDLALSLERGPAALAHEVFARGQWQRVHVIDRRHLANVARLAQATPQRQLTLDQYYHLIHTLIWGDHDGYISLPPHPGHWYSWTYAGIKAFVDRLPDPATVALGVLDGAATEIGLILDLRGGLIRKLTTFEAFGVPAPTFELTADSFERLWALLGDRGAAGAPMPAAALLCSRATFDAWLLGEDKLGALEQAALRGDAFWRLRDAMS